MRTYKVTVELVEDVERLEEEWDVKKQERVPTGKILRMRDCTDVMVLCNLEDVDIAAVFAACKPRKSE